MPRRARLRGTVVNRHWSETSASSSLSASEKKTSPLYLPASAGTNTTPGHVLDMPAERSPPRRQAATAQSPLTRPRFLHPSGSGPSSPRPLQDGRTDGPVAVAAPRLTTTTPTSESLLVVWHCAAAGRQSLCFPLVCPCFAIVVFFSF